MLVRRRPCDLHQTRSFSIPGVEHCYSKYFSYLSVINPSRTNIAQCIGKLVLLCLDYALNMSETPKEHLTHLRLVVEVWKHIN
jgi:hypothetical protein